MEDQYIFLELGKSGRHLRFEEDGIEMNASQSFRCLMSQTCDYKSSPVSTLSDPSTVSITEAIH
jgi:hypothetical protein